MPIAPAIFLETSPLLLSLMHRRSQGLLILAILSFCLSGLLSEAQAFRVVIDAGHGGHDSGARDGAVYEKHLNLDVSRRLARYLNRRGIKTVYTRPTNKFVSLGNRVAKANRYRDAIFVSIHFNSASNRGATGIETFFYSPQSELLAHLVQTNMIHKTRLVDRGVKHRGFMVIRRTNIPAILVEGGFLSNRRESRRCSSAAHRQKLAEAIGHAIIRYRKVR